ncbi:MAG TPA: hypothetical protein PLT35_05710 [Vicinamibacterales bacterium]|nr:hypothetical protein [Vicinamibacterales bacterium]HOQ61037.1 hypothetical protein [Vicinamibacterales bacterium]
MTGGVSSGPLVRAVASACAALAALWLPGTALAQPGSAAPPRAEIWGAFAVGAPTSGSAIEIAYAPPFRLGGTPLESRANQILAVDTGTAFGLDTGLNLFVSRVFGIQAAFSTRSADIGGANGDFHAFLRYISRPPPDYQPREGTYERSDPWAATAGQLRRRSVALGGVVRWGAGRPVGGTIAGGVEIGRLTGEIESAGYQQFVLGGHSTLFSVRHRARLRPAAGERLYSPYVGADVHVAMSGRVALAVGVRVPLTPGRSVPVEAAGLVDPSEDAWAPELADVKLALDGQPLELRGTPWHAFAGLKLFLF